MVHLLALLLLLLGHYLLPLAATVRLRSGAFDFQPYSNPPHIVSQETLRNCYTALDLIPKGLEVDPNYIAAHHPGPGSSKPISLKFTKYDRNGDKIKFPASFQVGNCSINVYEAGGWVPPGYRDPRFSPPAMLHYYIWPYVRKQAKIMIDKIVEECPSRYGFLKSDALTSLQYIRQGMVFEPDVGNGWFLFETRVLTDKEMVIQRDSWQHFNIYRPEGQINDIKWPIPFQRPQNP
jgi:hypothetical protein